MVQPLRLSFHKFEKNVYLNGYYTFYPLFVGDWPKMKCQHNLLPHRLVRSNKFHLARVFHSWTLFLGKKESIQEGYSRMVLKIQCHRHVFCTDGFLGSVSFCQ